MSTQRPIRTKTMTSCLRRMSLAAGLLGIMAQPCSATDVYLVAKQFIKTMPAGAEISMWGFAEDLDGDLSTSHGEVPTVPGPMIQIPPGETVLNIHLRNDLREAVSIVIAGQRQSLSPVFFTDAAGRERVKAFTTETAPLGGIGLYTWDSLKPGTYLYQSGSHPAVQVQMGLYGGVTQDAVTGQAYADASTAFDHEIALLYSEIDPALHTAVATGVYGTAAYPSTIHYEPTYFLINGRPFRVGQRPTFAGNTGETTLIRFLNAGLLTHLPTILRARWNVIAENGSPYPYPKDQYTVMLAAGSTMDVLMEPSAAGTLPIYDHRMYLTSNGVPSGGMLVQLDFGSAAPASGSGSTGQRMPGRGASAHSGR